MLVHTSISFATECQCQSIISRPRAHDRQSGKKVCARRWPSHFSNCAGHQLDSSLGVSYLQVCDLHLLVCVEVCTFNTLCLSLEKRSVAGLLSLSGAMLDMRAYEKFGRVVAVALSRTRWEVIWVFYFFVIFH